MPALVSPIEDQLKLLQELAQDWPEEAGLYFLSLIYNKRGIEIV